MASGVRSKVRRWKLSAWVIALQILMFVVAFHLLATKKFCHAFRPTKGPSTSKWKSMLFMSQPDTPVVSGIPRAYDALQSPKMARQVRRYRTRRGKGHSAPFIVPVRTNNEKAKTEGTCNSGSYRMNGLGLPYESTLSALQAYHSIHGDLVMPRRYTVPRSSVFPSEWHSVDLASTVYNMRWWQINVKEKPERVAELGKLGFVWERLQPEWNLILEGLITYSSLFGNLLVPNKFVVPHGNSKWPRATWGLALGNCVYRIRARNDFLLGTNSASRRDQLDQLGFIWDVHEYSFNKFYAALRHFASLNFCGPFSAGGQTKALRVPSTFVVPSNDLWPNGLWGYPLGNKCSAVRQKELYVKGKPRRKQLLEELGFRWSGNSDLGWLKVVHAAAIYSRLNARTLDVPYHFIVPEPPSCDAQADWPWPGKFR